MRLKYPFVFVIYVIIAIVPFVFCQDNIANCHQYRDIYEVFSSCALSSMFGGTNRYTFQQLSHINQKDILNKPDLLQVVNYWCSVLDLASTCTDGKALHCSNRDQIHSLVKTTGGLCENGRIKEEFESFIPETFTYDTKCEDYALDIIETCENNVPEIDYDVGIEDGVEEMMRNVEQVLRCNAKVLKESPDQCVSSRDSLLMYTFRTLSYSVPHALGVELNVSTVVMDIIAL